MNKRFHFMSFLLGCLFIIIIGAVFPQLWAVVSPSTPTETLTEETLVLPVNTDGEVFSKYDYSGWVTIQIRGEGRISRDVRHNAFGTLNADGTRDRFSGFTIDGKNVYAQVLTFVVPTATNQQTHEYTFLYYVGEQKRNIGFLMRNGNRYDRSEFTVHIIGQNIISAGGR